MTELSDRVRVFRQLHQQGCFVIPNPWDIGSARVLAQLGFKALATTSAGFAWSVGCADHQVSLGAMLEHLTVMSRAVDVPINADFGSGFAVAPEKVADHVTRAAATGIAGLSIEDSTGNPSEPLFEFTLAVERIKAARQALDRSRTGVLLTARSEGFVAGRPDIGETVRRLTAFAEAGADCLYAPGIKTMADVNAVVRAVAPKPVNVLVGSDFTTVAELAEAGVRRISVGGALARTAWTGYLTAAREIAERGTFSSFSGGLSGVEINKLFRTP
jgi:2-methylisocitrate lyase-like PEP mutase family enzyme